MVKDVDKLVKAIVPMPNGKNITVTGKTSKIVDARVRKIINSPSFMKRYYVTKKTGGKIKKKK